MEDNTADDSSPVYFDEADRVVDLRALAKSRRDKRVSEYQSHGQYHKQEQESEDTNVEE